MGREKENYIEQLLKERDLERQVMVVPIQEISDQLVGDTDPVPDPDPSILKKNCKKKPTLISTV
jgi:hypothetical protein